MTKEEIYKAAIDRWGCPAQVDMLVEECAELIVSVNKYRRSGDLSICEEMADVEIMLEQIRVILGVELSSHIDEWKTNKLIRLEKRLFHSTSDN